MRAPPPHRAATLGTALMLGLCTGCCGDLTDTAGCCGPHNPPVSSRVAQPATSSSNLASSTMKFVRKRPEPMPERGIEPCVYLGFAGTACLSALLEEKVPVVKRYMRRLSDADAWEAQNNLRKKEPAGVAHAEAAMFCAHSGPCKKKNAEGVELDDGYSCLTKAEIALQEGDHKAAVKSHARACKCDPIRAQIPVMGGVLACNGPNKPVKRGQNLSQTEAKEIRDCATCDPKTGPAACQREIVRLKNNDADLARYLEMVHMPRCARP